MAHIILSTTSPPATTTNTPRSTNSHRNENEEIDYIDKRRKKLPLPTPSSSFHHISIHLPTPASLSTHVRAKSKYVKSTTSSPRKYVKRHKEGEGMRQREGEIQNKKCRTIGTMLAEVPAQTPIQSTRKPADSLISKSRCFCLRLMCRSADGDCLSKTGRLIDRHVVSRRAQFRNRRGSFQSRNQPDDTPDPYNEPQLLSLCTKPETKTILFCH